MYPGRPLLTRVARVAQPHGRIRCGCANNNNNKYADKAHGWNIGNPDPLLAHRHLGAHRMTTGTEQTGILLAIFIKHKLGRIQSFRLPTRTHTHRKCINK